MISVRKTSVVKLCCYLILFVFGVEILFINTTLIWLFIRIKHEFDFINSLKELSMSSVLSHFQLDQFVHNGRSGGFAKLLQETLGRLHMVSYPPGSKVSGQYPQVTFFGLDVSQNLEASMLIRRINSRTRFPYKRLIVDVGANDGLLSSHSFNFIQWGWSAVLVEPMSTEMSMAKINTNRYTDPYNDKTQNVSFVKGVIGEKSGLEVFVVTGRSFYTESHIYKENEILGESDMKIQVRSYTAVEIAQEYNIPKYFGILSVDAEGHSYLVMQQWLKNGYRPAYIIIEMIHERPVQSYYSEMLARGYRFMSQFGWNCIFEHQTQGVHEDE